MRLALACVLSLGCHLDPTPDGAPVVDDQTVLMELSSHDLQAVTAKAYPSQLGNWIDEWVTPGSASTYGDVTPDHQGSNVQMPVGTLIVRQVVDASGVVQKVTLMVKGPPGYNPTLGDWWFGVLDAVGNPTELGRLTQCYSCHANRADDDFLFGVPLADRPS